MLDDLETLKSQLSDIRKQGSTMGPAVQKALEEAIGKAAEAVTQLNVSLVVDDDE